MPPLAGPRSVLVCVPFSSGKQSGTPLLAYGPCDPLTSPDPLPGPQQPQEQKPLNLSVLFPVGSALVRPPLYGKVPRAGTTGMMWGWAYSKCIMTARREWLPPLPPTHAGGLSSLALTGNAIPQPGAPKYCDQRRCLWLLVNQIQLCSSPV